MVEVTDWKDVSVLEENMASMDMPDELREILEKYIELYRLAQRCYDNILAEGLIRVSTYLRLKFDARGGELMGDVDLEDIIREWGALSLHGAAMIWQTHYDCPNEEDMTSKLEELLKPLEDVGWCISVTRTRVGLELPKYEAYCLISDDAMMTGVKQGSDEAFFRRFFGFKIKSEYEYEGVIRVAEKAISRERQALGAMKEYGVTRGGLGLSKEPAICRVLEGIIEAAKNMDLDKVRELIEEIDIDTVKEELLEMLKESS